MRISNVSIRPFRIFALLAVAVAARTSVQAAPLAGTAITNQASISYQDAGSGYVSTLQSNIVEVAVQPLEALQLEQNRSVREPAGAPVHFAHRLTNTGNVRSSYRITLNSLPNNNFEMAEPRVYHDVNGNGQVDAGEPILTESARPALESGAAMNLVITAQVPSMALPEQKSQLQITATSQAQGVQTSNVDTVTVTAGVSLMVTKTASRTSANPGENVTFTFSALNRGNTAPLTTTAQIDGVMRELMLLRDVIPTNTSLVELRSSGIGLKLYHRRGDVKHAYSTRPPQDITTVDAVGYGVSQFPTQGAIQAELTVQLHPAIAGDVRNTAQFIYGVSGASQPREQNSNEVVVQVSVAPPSIQYYTDNTFTRMDYVTSVGDRLFIQVAAANCNLNPNAAETLTVTVHSQLTGDTEQYTAIENGSNSGIFRVSDIKTELSRGRSGVSNLQQETVPRDQLLARAMCRGILVETAILVDPFGVIYDSRTNTSIPGARVTLIDVTGNGNGGRAGEPATVFDEDGVSSAPNSVVTTADGRFVFPRVAASTYRLQIVPPANYQFPSQVPPALQPAGRNVDVSASYGGNFQVSAATGAVQVDVPLDGSTPSGLFIRKVALNTQVEIGDFADFELTIKNTSGIQLANANLTDRLPSGFKFASGSARLGGNAITPNNGAGSSLTFPLGTLNVDAEVTLTYRVLVGPGSKIGKNVNRAQVQGTSPFGAVTSNEATATVDVSGGVLDGKGIFIGRVFVDKNGDGIVQPDEPGIPGVRIWVENGNFVITDEDGKYSIYGMDPRTHNVKVDASTLPTGVKLYALTPRHAENGGSYWADLKIGEMHKVNFATRTATEAVLSEIATRRKDAASWEAETNGSLKAPLTVERDANISGDPRSLPSNGFISNSTIQLDSTRTTAPLTSSNSNLPAPPVKPAPSPKLADMIAELSAETGFIDLKEGDTLPSTQVNVRVKGPQGSEFKLTANGTEVPRTRVGTRASDSTRQVEAWEYVGIKLLPGKNLLQLDEIDSFGVPRNTRRITVIAPGNLGKLEVSVAKRQVYADGHTSTAVKVRLVDANGAVVSARTPITLEAERGQWDVADLNSTERGVQVFIEGGSAEFSLLAPSAPGSSRIRVTSGLLEGSTVLDFVPELRPLVATGVIDAKINLFGFNPSGLTALNTKDLFDDEEKARAALFLKGRVLGKYLLTLRYDSQKTEDDRLFRDIQPDKYYPVYGDASIRGFDAQSTSKLYVRMDRDKSFALFGDYTTDSPSTARSLGQYQRSFTGSKLHHETDRLSANAFVTRNNQRQVVDEFRGNGTSGPYFLRVGDIVEQSEKVEIIVRDRNQPSVVLSVTPQSRFTDYEMNGLSQGIIFRSPIASTDANLNPIFIRVTYEVEQGGGNFTVAGVDAQYKLNDKLEVGGSYLTDRNPQEPFNLRSLNATFRIAPGTTIVGELAQSDRSGVEGAAHRVEVTHESESLSARAFVGHSDTNFDNPSSLLSQGRDEATLKATYKLNGNSRLIAEALSSKDVNSGDKRVGAQVAVEKSLPGNVRVEVGVRHVRENGNSQPTTVGAGEANFTSLRAKVTAPVPNMPQANVFAEYERAISGEGQALAVGGDYQLANCGRLYLRHELLSSLNGRYGLNDQQDQNTTLVGIDTDYMRNGRVFSEYRVRGGIAGRDAEAAIGLRNGWDLGKGLRANTSFERIKDMGGSVTGAANGSSLAVTGALEYTRKENLKATGRLELRNGSNSDSTLATFGVAHKVNSDLTLLGKGIMSRIESSGGNGDSGLRQQNRALLGLAYRPKDNDRLNSLIKYEYRQDKLRGVASRLRQTNRVAHIVAADLNYQPTRRWTMSTHYAAKLNQDRAFGERNKSLTQLLAMRLTRDLNRRTDFSLLASTLWGDHTRQTSLGAEVRVRLSRNLRLGLGYNFGSLDDEDLLGPNSNGRGLYLRLGFQFDESIFGGEDLTQ